MRSLIFAAALLAGCTELGTYYPGAQLVEVEGRAFFVAPYPQGGPAVYVAGPNEPGLAEVLAGQGVSLPAANVAANDLAGRVTCVEAAGFDHSDLAQAAPFDLIFANILKGPLMALAPQLCGALDPNGHAILSGILVEQADDVVAEYARFGANLTRREDIGDWSTLILARNG